MFRLDNPMKFDQSGLDALHAILTGVKNALDRWHLQVRISNAAEQIAISNGREVITGSDIEKAFADKVTFTVHFIASLAGASKVAKRIFHTEANAVQFAKLMSGDGEYFTCQGCHDICTSDLFCCAVDGKAMCRLCLSDSIVMAEEIDSHIGGLIDSNLNSGCMGPTVATDKLEALQTAVNLANIPSGYSVAIQHDEETKTYFPYLDKVVK